MHDEEDATTTALLARARHAWSPSAQDLERVRSGIAAAVASQPPSLNQAPATDRNFAPTHGPSPAGGSRGLRIGGWARRVLVTAAFTAAGASVGYWAGRRSERQANFVVQSLPSPSTSAAHAEAPPLVGTRNETKVDPGLGPSVGAGLPPGRKSVVAAARSVPPVRRAMPEASLSEEVRALRNVERALRDGNAGLASAFLDDLDRSVPGGQMQEERAALRAIARCTAGRQPFGVNLADDFVAAYAASVYRRRVQDACKETDSRGLGHSTARGETHDP